MTRALPDEYGVPIFTTTIAGLIPLPCPPMPGEREASPVSTFPQVERAAREGFINPAIPEYATPWRVIEGTFHGYEAAAVLDAGGRTLFFMKNAVVAWEIATDRNRGRA